jgi:hypothetical protein
MTNGCVDPPEALVAGPSRGESCGMDSEASSLQQVKFRTFDLSDSPARSSIRGLPCRVVTAPGFMIVQCSVTAGFSWFIASQLLGHEVPYFAAVACTLVLAWRTGSGCRGVDIAIGVPDMLIFSRTARDDPTAAGERFGLTSALT